MLSNIKIACGAILVIIFVVCAFCISSLSKQVKVYKGAYATELNNKRALESEIDSLADNTELLKYTVKDIKAAKDSIALKLYKVNKELKHKDKSIKQLQYLLSSAEKTDSVVFRDTLFISRDIQVDTMIGDEWINTRLQLEYPSTIKITPQVKSEKMVFMNEVKKIDGVPSKIFFIRWFQKKYKTIEVDVIENNPYIVNDRSKFIEIIK